MAVSVCTLEQACHVGQGVSTVCITLSGTDQRLQVGPAQIVMGYPMVILVVVSVHQHIKLAFGLRLALSKFAM